jgi:hypothetical protein
VDVLNDLIRGHADFIDKLVDPYVNDARISFAVGLVMAGAEAMLRVIARRMGPRAADRLRVWIGGLLYEYRFRVADPEEGAGRAAEWLLRELEKEPPRRPRTETEDIRIVLLRDELRRRLAPIFARYPYTSAARDSAIRPIAESVVGRRLPRRLTRSPHHRLDEFIPAFLRDQLGYTVVRRSKAARRFRVQQAQALILHERKLRIALQALSPQDPGRSGLLEELNSLQQYIAKLRTPRRPPRKAQ